MSEQEQSVKALLMAGNLYLDFLDEDGNSTGFKTDIEVSEFAVTHNDPEEQVVRSKKRNQYGNRVAGRSLPQGTQCTITTPEASDRDIIAAQFLGWGEDVDIVGSAVTDEEVKMHTGKWTKLPHVNIDETVPVTADDGSTNTYVEGTDFEVNHRLGLVRPMEGGSITDGQAAFFDYTHTGAGGFAVEGSTRQEVHVRVLLDGTNLMTNERAEFYADKIALRPGEGFDLMGDEPAAPQFEGEFERVSTNPLYRYRNLGSESA